MRVALSSPASGSMVRFNDREAARNAGASAESFPCRADLL